MNVVIEKWSEILDRVKVEHELSDVSFNTWLKPLKVNSVKGDLVTIFVPSEQVGLNYVSKKYTLPIKVAIAEVAGKSYDIKFVLNEGDEVKPVPPKIENVFANANLNPKYTFDTFVVGNNNTFAHAASVAVSESPGEERINPLILWGGVGLGKTHLMHSIAHNILENNPQAQVLYVTSETFTNEVIDAIRNGNSTAMPKFREKYRNIDVLLIDDIQFIIGKESTQEEFFHTFNTLINAKKQIVISSDKPPSEMKTLDERIQSRFAGGVPADITLPNYETRMAILRKKEERDGYNIDDRVIEYIASNVKSNIRELEGALNKIIAYATLEKKEITLPLAEQVLKDVISPNEKKVISIDVISKAVAEHFDVSAEDLKGKRKYSEIAFPRQIAMFLCREMLDTSLTSIGKAFGNRDHSTVIHACEKVSTEIKNSEDIENTVNILRKKINPPK